MTAAALKTVFRLNGHAMDELKREIGAIERRLSVNEQECARAADRLEVELRVASELPHLDTAAFSAAQRQRIGALGHERKRLTAELETLRERLSGVFVDARPVELALERHEAAQSASAAKTAQANLDEVAGRTT
ncbi:MAG: flagellar FliJ family protein [Pseudomonadota bacterium]